MGELKIATLHCLGNNLLENGMGCICGSRHDPLLAIAEPMARDLFEHRELAITDDERPYANHALPDQVECYEPILECLSDQAA